MEIELRSDGEESESRLRSIVEAQLEAVAPSDARVVVEVRGAEATVTIGDLRATEAAPTAARAVKQAAGALKRRLRPRFPPTTPLDPDAPASAYWRDRLARHTRDSYAGVRMAKFPEDLRAYEHLLWAARPNVVIEIGVYRGGSALWFRDRLRTLAAYGAIVRPLYVGVDMDLDGARADLAAADPAYEETIALVEGDVTDPALPDEVARRLPEGARCLVVEDSAHTQATTTAALRGFARFVPPHGFFVVEDGCVDHDDLRLADDWPRGVLPALHEWLRTDEGRRFRIRRDLELYGITSHPEGFLQRVAP
jgi:cephalosporin hydroxylase